MTVNTHHTIHDERHDLIELYLLTQLQGKTLPDLRDKVTALKINKH